MNLKLKIKIMKLVIFIFSIECFSQNHSLKILKDTLNEKLLKFEKVISEKPYLNYIDVNVFKKLVNAIDSEMYNYLLQQNSVLIQIATHKKIPDTTIKISMYYSNKAYFGYSSKNCYYNCDCDYKKYNNLSLISGFCTTIKDVIALDTIQNVIITTPIKSKYILYKPERWTSKKELLNDFKSVLFNQYQLRISKNVLFYSKHQLYQIYFIAPPTPNSKFRFKFKSTKF